MTTPSPSAFFYTLKEHDALLFLDARLSTGDSLLIDPDAESDGGIGVAVTLGDGREVTGVVLAICKPASHWRYDRDSGEIRM